ncbi:MAG TPA: hypothetical protein P5531_01530 [Bacteroidales bacterium]|nr:hypothetical protein [Bacteroidales bacterium]HSA42336.1 hypothetical protein [Bacteroidales bacterium]
MKKKNQMTKFEWHDNCRMYHQLLEKAKQGNKQASRLIEKIKWKYEDEIMKERYEMHQTLELYQKACNGNISANVKIEMMKRKWREWEYWDKMVRSLGFNSAKSMLRKRKIPVKPTFHRFPDDV